MATTPLNVIGRALHEATLPSEIPRDLADIYLMLSSLIDLLRTLGSLSQRLGESLAALPGTMDGLRIDNLGEPKEPEMVRNSAAGELNATTIALGQAEAAAR